MTTQWQQPIDAYCERTTALFWAEPLNAVTNLAFIVAAIALARQRPHPFQADPAQRALRRLLVALIAAIGVGSFLFHTVATRWAALADVVPIFLFMHVYVAIFLRLRIGLPWRWAWLGVPAFTVHVVAVGALVRMTFASASASAGLASYVPAWLLLAVFAIWLALRRDPVWRACAAAVVVFGVSLLLRQLDEPVCEAWPLGTHFMWHVLNAVTLWVASAALFAPRPGLAPPPAGPSAAR